MFVKLLKTIFIMGNIFLFLFPLSLRGVEFETDGGLVVHLGCGEGELTCSLRSSRSYLVQGLDTDQTDIVSAVGRISEKGLNGPVTAKHWPHSHLPYADGVVNLLVVSENPAGVPEEEMMRVLAPLGALYIRSETGWKKIQKSWPAAMDEWTHYLHEAGGNPVANDKLVSHPGRLRWDAGPKYCRNHEMDVGIVAIVSSQGRMFSIIDEGLTGVMDPRLPESWSLVARDAFSGVLLWKKALSEWGWKQWKPEMNWNELRAQRRLIPIGLPRRLVADGDRVFVTSRYGGPVEAIDAVSGRVLKEFVGTAGADEMVFLDGKLFVVVRKRNYEISLGKETAGSILALDADSGAVAWRKDGNILPLSLAACGPNVFYHTGAQIACLKAESGEVRWRVDNAGKMGSIWNVSQGLLAYKDVVLTYSMDRTRAYSAEDGSLLWSAGGGRKPFGYSHPSNTYVINGQVWLTQGVGKTATAAKLSGLDLHTGKVTSYINLPKHIFSVKHHFRCYRGKATDRFILENKRGVEFMAIDGDDHSKNDWVRGVCRYGVLPCNGLLYTPPTPCSCYPTALLTGFNALAPRSSEGERSAPAAPRFIQGPAFGRISDSSDGNTPSDWPTLRANTFRTGASVSPVDLPLKRKWEAKTGGKPTQPVVAGKLLLVASAETQTVHALDADAGEEQWRFVSDGGIDSPPTLHKGTVLFGSRNGWVYCLNAADGKLAWRFRVAPNDRQIVSYDRVESVWPLHGSVLVVDNVVYAAAGRSSYLDGGIRVVGLDAKTGELRHETVARNAHQNPETDKGDGYDMPGSKPDVLQSDGNSIFMQSLVFNRELKKPATPANIQHIFATAGFLDDQAWHRSFWIVGSEWNAGNKTAVQPGKGQLLVQDGDVICGVRYFTNTGAPFSLMFYPEKKGYCVFSHDTTAPSAGNNRRGKKSRSGKGTTASVTGRRWEKWLPVRVRAMVKAEEVLFIAGPPDILKKDDPMASFEGRLGSVLLALSAKDGTEQMRLELKEAPVFDGMIAANGMIYMSTTDGSLIAFSPRVRK